MSESDDILVFIKNYINSLPKTINEFISTEKVRYGVVVLVVLLNVYNYKHNKQKCFMG